MSPIRRNTQYFSSFLTYVPKRFYRASSVILWHPNTLIRVTHRRTDPYFTIISFDTAWAPIIILTFVGAQAVKLLWVP